jgi:hypothetical protein
MTAMRYLVNLFLIFVAIVLTSLRINWCPHFDHSWPIVFMAASHVFVGVCVTMMFWPKLQRHERFFYALLWLVPGLIEFWAFKTLRLP